MLRSKTIQWAQDKPSYSARILIDSPKDGCCSLATGSLRLKLEIRITYKMVRSAWRPIYGLPEGPTCRDRKRKMTGRHLNSVDSHTTAPLSIYQDADGWAPKRHGDPTPCIWLHISSAQQLWLLPVLSGAASTLSWTLHPTQLTVPSCL